MTLPGAAHWREALLDAVAEAQLRDPHSQLGVGTGWSSDKLFFHDPRTFPLQVAILHCATAHLPRAPFIFGLSGWANVMQIGRAHV